MTITGTNHGLSVHTVNDAATTDNRRLRRPVDGVVTNSFNDATSVFKYSDIYGDRGHEGIDFSCRDASVVAMYGGVVVETRDNWKTGGSSDGNYVKIRSCTDRDGHSGFEHAYLHLKSVAVAVGDAVTKGQQLGTSGDTGTPGAFHLHVHLRPFNSEGKVPSSRENSAMPSGWERGDPLLPPVRVRGCMNFDCFLPPDDAGLSAIDGKTLDHTGKLLSPRDANAVIPVYREIFTPSRTTPPNRTLLPEADLKAEGNRLGTINGSRLGCYAVLGEYPNANNPVWYRIQFGEGVSGKGWVSRTVMWKLDKDNDGDFDKDDDENEIEYEVVWVHVEAAPGTKPGVPDHPYFVTINRNDVNIRRYPNADTGGGAPVEGKLTPHLCYAVLGTFEDPRTKDSSTNPATFLTEKTRRWWQIDLTPDYIKATDVPEANVGWVRDDAVWAYTDRRSIPAAWPAAPRYVSVQSMGTTVRLDWLPPLPLQAEPPSLNVTGYRIWRYQDPSVLSTVGNTKVFDDIPAENTHWTDNTAEVAVSPHALLYYQIAAKVDYTVGAASGYASVAVIDSSLLPRPQPGPRPYTTTFVPVAALYGDHTMVYNPGGLPLGTTGVLLQGAFRPALAVMAPSGFGGSRRDVWLRVRNTLVGASGGASAQSGAGQDSHIEGWAPESALQGTGNWQDQVETLPQPPFVRAHGSWQVPVRIGPSLGYTEYLTQITSGNGWYEVIGRSADWWQIRLDAAREGWVQDSQVETTGDTPGVPVVNPVQPPLVPGPGGSNAPADSSWQASGPFLNLANSWQGSWGVSKSGTTVTAAFGSSRSPVQYLARQNPQPLFVLPAGFRPTVAVPHEARGTHVHENGSEYPGSPQADFDLTIGTNGELRYVDNSKVTHVGFLKYQVTKLQWETAEAVEVPSAPTISATGTFINQQDHVGSRWSLSRTGDEVEGSFSCSRSPVDYYANGNPGRDAVLVLPADYRPAANKRIQVKGAVRVNKDGTDSADTRKVNFWLTMQSDGYMWYDADSNLGTLGVGYLRFSVDVGWDAAPRVTVPSVPRDLEVDDVEADEVELDWRSPADDGGDAVDEYKVEEYRNGRWREVDDDISRTGYDVEDLDPYTTYTFRVLARNSAGWSAPSTAVTVTTPRETPGEPGRPTATATHERVELDWAAPASGGRVTGYRVERKVGSDDYQVVAADTGSAVSFFVDRDVRAGTTYRYRVAAHNHGELGDWSSSRSVTTAAAPTIPGQPTGLTVGPGTESRLQLNWTAPTDTGGGITGYQVECSPDETPRVWSVVQADTGSDTATWTENAVDADTVYYYRVSARNSAGVGTSSAEAEGHTRPRLRLDGLLPYPLTAHTEPRTASAVTATFAFFLPERTCDLVGQVPGADGWWRVLLFDASGSGPYWLPAGAGTTLGDTSSLPQPPGVPQGFTATLANNQVTLGWQAPTSGSTVTGYRVWRQEDSGAFAQLGSDLAATATAHTDTTVQTGRVYRYWLQAQSAAGWGLPTATVAIAVMTMPEAPAAVTHVTATSAAAGTSLQLGWARAATGGLPTGYRVAWRVSGTVDDFETETVAGTAHELTELVPGTAYEIQVTAFNQEGDAPVASHTGATVLVAPGVPEAVAVAATGQDATATWAAPATGGRPNAYHVQSKTQATAAWPATHTTVTGLSHSLSGLGYEVAHDLRVRASNTAGESAWVAVAFTTEALPRVPGTPTGLTATPSADSQMQLRWTAPTDAGSPALTSYRIERSADATPRVWMVVAEDTDSPRTTWDDSGLAAATTYRYRVSARNRTGTGTASMEAAGTTRPQAALLAAATYPLTAHAWPEAAAPATHTWSAHDAALKLDVAGRVGGTDSWWRVVRFGAEADGPYWLSAVAVAVTGAATAVPAAPGLPGSFRSTAATHESATLTWSPPATGGTVTGYRLWRRTGTEAWAALDAIMDAATLTHSDNGLAAGTVYRYRLQALSAAGAGVPTAAVSATTLAQVPPLVREYGAGTHTLDFPAGYTTFFAQLCGGGGGGAGGREPAYNGGEGGDGGCTFHATNRGGHTWTLVVGTGGDGGEYNEDWHEPGSDGESTVLQKDGIAAATAAGGQGGQGSRSRPGSDGATVGSSRGWPTDWTSLRRAPRGGRGGAGFHEEDGRDGAAGQARILFTGTPTGYVPVMPTELVVAPGREGRLRLSWEEGATVGPATGYRIERSADVEPPVWTEVAANTGTTARVWHDNNVAADTVYRYRVTGHNAAGWGSPSPAAAGRTRPQATLLTTAAYPLTAHAWPAAAAPATHTWAAHDAAVKLDVAGQAGGPDSWYRVLRFDAGDADAYWLPAAAVRVTGAVTTVPAAPGVPVDLAVPEITDTRANLTWTAPATGGSVTGYRLWRQTGTGAWTLIGDTLAADVLTHTDTDLTASTGYRYRLQALSAGGPGLPTGSASIITAALPPQVRNYADGSHTLTIPAGYDMLYVQFCGGGGGGGGAGSDYSNRHSEHGGTGGVTYYRAGVTAGDILELFIGEGGDGGEGGRNPDDGEHGGTSHLELNGRTVAIGKRGLGGAGGSDEAPNNDGNIRGSSAGWPASWPGDARRPAGGDGGVRSRRGGDGEDGEEGLARVLLTPIVPLVVPGTPTDLTAAPSADSRMALGWTAPATGAVVAGYRIERSPDVEPRAWAVIVEDTGRTAESWDDAVLDGDTVYHYRVTARSVVVLGVPSEPATGRTRPQAALLATAAYPLAARAWPLATAPATHTWPVHDTTVQLDVVARDAGGSWYRVLRFGAGIAGDHWLPAAAVTVTGATADLPQAPGVPGDLAPPTATHEAVGLSWSASTTGGAVTGYRVWRQTGEEAFTVPGADLAATATTHTDTTVADSTAYQYRVQALSAAGLGVRTPAVAVTTAATPREPGVPTDVTAAPGDDSQMVLGWTAPMDAGTQPITGYRVERAAEATTLDWVEVAADTGSTDTAWSDSSLAAATTHHYRVRAHNAVGVGDPSASAAGTTRPQATLVATATYPLTAHQWPVATAPVSHTWSAHDASVQLEVAGQGAGGGGWYRVLRFGQGADGPYWLPAASVTVTGATTDLPQVPGAPGDLRTTDRQGRVALAWSAPATGGTVTGYRLWRQTGEAAWAVLADSLTSDALAYTDTAVTAATTYRYRLQAQSAAGYGVRTTVIDALVTAPAAPTVPAAPTALRAAPGTDSQMQLGWTAPADAGTQPITGYRIERSADVDPRVWTDAAADTGDTATTWSDRGLAAAATHHYRVSARNSVGVGEPSAETAGTTRPQAALLAAAAYPLTARRWPAATAPASHTWSVHDAAVRLDVAGQVRGTPGWWRVLRFGAGAEGPYWLPATAVTVAGTTAAVPEVPGRPRTLTAAPGDGSSMQLNWTAAAAGGAATGYRIERSADVTPRVWTEVAADTGTTATTWQDSGLAAATRYHYRVAGRNAAGPGTPSASAAGTTRPQLTLLAAATYPLTAHAWPLAAAPVTHTWAVHDAVVKLDVVAQGAGGGGWYRVLRFGADADGPFWLPAGAVSVTGTTTALPQAPGVPGAFGTPVATHAAVTLTWTAPTTGGTVTGYRLWRQTGEEAFAVLGTDLAADVLTHTDTTVMGRTAYRYRVQALAAAGAGVRNAAVGVTTAETPRVPGAPTGLEAAPGDNSRMQLSWTAPTDAGTQPISGYRIERSADVNPRVWADAAADTGSSAVTWSDHGLAAATTYHYRVRARNKVGVGQPSPAATGRTRPQLSLKATTTFGLNVRSGPGTSHGIVGSITGGSTTRYDILGKDAATAVWYQIRFSSTVTGWVHGDYVQTHGSLDGLAVTWTPPQLSLKATTTFGLNVRSGPGTSHGIVGSITGGSTTRYDILGKDAATAVWYQIRFSSTVTGWVHGDYVQTHGSLDGLAVTWTPPQLSLKATTTFGLNVRSGPGTSHGIVGTITGGSTTRYDILGKDAATPVWWQIQFSAAVIGWVHGAYVQTHGNLGSVPIR